VTRDDDDDDDNNNNNTDIYDKSGVYKLKRGNVQGFTWDNLAGVQN
jgi:hypothetical protein